MTPEEIEAVVAELMKRMKKLAEAQEAFVYARQNMNAARPNYSGDHWPTAAEKAVYNERCEVDNEMHRELVSQALKFAKEAPNFLPALRAHLQSQGTQP